VCISAGAWGQNYANCNSGDSRATTSLLVKVVKCYGLGLSNMLSYVNGLQVG
jgi:hypothetical protein